MEEKTEKKKPDENQGKGKRKGGQKPKEAITIKLIRGSVKTVTDIVKGFPVLRFETPYTAVIIGKVEKDKVRPGQDCLYWFKDGDGNIISEGRIDESGTAKCILISKESKLQKKVKVVFEIVALGELRVAEDEFEIPLPAGGLRNESKVFWLRRWKNLIYMVKASIGLAVTIFFLEFASGNNMNWVLGILLAALISWRMHEKIKPVRTYIGYFLSLAILVLCWFFPHGIVWSMEEAFIYAYLWGGIFFWAEEFIRKPDGNPYLNFYPMVIAGVALVFLAFNIFAFFGSSNPSETVHLTGGVVHLGKPSFWSRVLSIDYLVPGKWWRWLSDGFYISRMEAIHNIKTILIFIVILIAYAIPSEFVDYVRGKSGRGAGAAVADGSGPASIFFFLTEAWLVLKGILSRFGKSIKKTA